MSCVAPGGPGARGFYALARAPLRRGAGCGAAVIDRHAAASSPPTPESEDGRALAESWRKLIAASMAMDAAAAADEYQNLFVGVGKSEVSAHASSYLKAPGRTPLIEIRGSLARLGLARQSGVNMYEDHLAAVCETMQALITRRRAGGTLCFCSSNAISSNPTSAHGSSIAALQYKILLLPTTTAESQNSLNCSWSIERDSFAIE